MNPTHKFEVGDMYLLIDDIGSRGYHPRIVVLEHYGPGIIFYVEGLSKYSRVTSYLANEPWWHLYEFSRKLNRLELKLLSCLAE